MTKWRIWKQYDVWFAQGPDVDGIGILTALPTWRQALAFADELSEQRAIYLEASA